MKEDTVGNYEVPGRVAQAITIYLILAFIFGIIVGLWL